MVIGSRIGWCPVNLRPQLEVTEVLNESPVPRHEMSWRELDSMAPVSNDDGTWTIHWMVHEPMKLFRLRVRIIDPMFKFPHKVTHDR